MIKALLQRIKALEVAGDWKRQAVDDDRGAYLIHTPDNRNTPATVFPGSRRQAERDFPGCVIEVLQPLNWPKRPI